MSVIGWLVAEGKTLVHGHGQPKVITFSTKDTNENSPFPLSQMKSEAIAEKALKCAAPSWFFI